MDDLVFGDAPAPKGKKTRAKKVATPVADAILAPVSEKARKSGWPIIWIDAVEGQPNYEAVGINGEIYQIIREEEVPVPPAVVEVLRNAVAERIVQVHTPSGGVMTKRQKYSAIPWRLVGYVP